MSDIVQILQDEKLIGIQWDKIHMQKVLIEVLTLFQTQSKKIIELESKISNFTDKETFFNLQSSVDDHLKDSNDEINNLKKKMETNHKDFKNELYNLQESFENSVLSMRTETKRLISNELELFNPPSNSPKESPLIIKQFSDLNNTINDIKADINSIRSNLKNQNIQIPKQSSSDDQNIIKISSLEKRVDNFERRIVNYPEIESDLSTLMLQFPAVTKRLERKLNDCLTSVENISKTKSKVKNDPKPLLPPLNPVSIDSKPIITEIKENISKKSGLVDNNNDEIKIEPIKKEIKIEIDPILTKINNPKSEILPILDPETIPRTLTPPIEKIEEKTPVESPLSSGQISPKINNNSSFKINVLPNEPIVQVIETHTYKTELSSSMRVVSEIEWVKQMIQQHHDAIRQLQQGIRGQQDNFDTITENILKVNTTTNQKIAQLAQQNLHSQSENDNIRKQILEQLNLMQQKIINLSTIKIPENINQNLIQTSQNLEPLEIKPQSPKNENKKKSNNLPPLITKITQQISSNDTQPTGKIESQRSQSKKSTERKKEEMEEEENKNEPLSPKPRKKFTFTISHFTANVKEVPVPVIITKIHTPSKNTNVFSHTDLFTSIPPQPKIKPLKQNIIIDPSTNINELENLNHQNNNINNNKEIKKQTYIIEGGKKIKLGGPNRNRASTSHEQELSNISQEMIEEKVVVVARKVMKILTVNLQEDLKIKAEAMQKNVDKVITLIDGKIDRDFVERMFNKFRVMLNEINEKMENLQLSFLDWVTRDELELILQRFLGMVTNVNDTAGIQTKYSCLLCGKPKSHLSGMMSDVEKPTLETSPKKQTRSSLNSSYKKKKNDLNPQPRDVIQLLTN